MRFRSSLFRVLAVVFGALAAVIAVLALIPLARPAGVAKPERFRIPDSAILHRAAADLAAVQSRANGEGWSDDLVARALASLRLTAAAAIGQPISQQPLAGAGVVPEGRLSVDHGLIRKTGASVSSPVTADDVMRASAAGDSLSTTRKQQLEGLQSALTTLTSALYRKDASRDAAALDDAVRHAIAVARDLARERSGWKTWARR